MVEGLLQYISHEPLVCGHARLSMTMLKESIARDIKEGAVFAWITRLRQVEELYVRFLYLLLLADALELPHLLSEEPPNGFSPLYKRVNDAVFEGRGELELAQPGLHSGEFTPLKVMNQSTHVSLRAMMMAKGILQNPRLFDTDALLNRIDIYCDHLAHMMKMFSTGANKTRVLASLRSRYEQMSERLALKERR